jgi:hypothetical protein
MTPKEKAFELITKFQHPMSEMSDTDCLHIAVAKEFSLIAVDEVMEFMEADDFDSDTCYWANHSKMQYWVKVKQEIENL